MILLQTQTHKMRSSFEERMIPVVREFDPGCIYEPHKLYFTSTYVPDLLLSNGIYIELKGRLRPDDEVKLLGVIRDNPNIDLRIVFQNANNKCERRKKMRYRDWADKHGIKWAHGSIPLHWIREERTRLSQEV